MAILLVEEPTEVGLLGLGRRQGLVGLAHQFFDDLIARALHLVCHCHLLEERALN